jgi:cellulase
MLYAYKCPGNASDCRPPTGKEWFLIDAVAFDPDNNSNGPEGWMQFRFHRGQTVFANVPKGMQNGDYLFRHEIIAMHIATSRGSEFYVSCTQVRIVGGVNTSAKAAGAEMVAHPGAYVGDSRVRQNVFDNNIRRNFRMPGPRKFTGASGGGNQTATNTPRPTSTPPRPSNTNSPRPSNTDAINTTRNTNKPTSTGGSVINVGPTPTGVPKKRCRSSGSSLVTRALGSDEIITIRHYRRRSSRL